MDQGSVDPLFGPGPRTTIMDRVHGPPVMDRVHGHIVNFLERFCTGSMNNLFQIHVVRVEQKQKKKTRFDETLSTDAHD